MEEEKLEKLKNDMLKADKPKVIKKVSIAPILQKERNRVIILPKGLKMFQ